MRQVFAGTIVSLKTGMPHRMTTNTALLIWIGLPAIFLGGTKAFLLDIHKMDRQRCNRRNIITKQQFSSGVLRSFIAPRLPGERSSTNPKGEANALES
jgi:hypothetical protein